MDIFEPDNADCILVTESIFNMKHKSCIIDRNDHRTLFEIVKEYKFVPADTCSAMVIHNDVHRAVNDIIRDGDFRIMTWKMIHEQVSLMIPRLSMLQDDSEINDCRDRFLLKDFTNANLGGDDL